MFQEPEIINEIKKEIKERLVEERKLSGWYAQLEASALMPLGNPFKLGPSLGNKAPWAIVVDFTFSGVVLKRFVISQSSNFYHCDICICMTLSLFHCFSERSLYANNTFYSLTYQFYLNLFEQYFISNNVIMYIICSWSN